MKKSNLFLLPALSLLLSSAISLLYGQEKESQDYDIDSMNKIIDDQLGDREEKDRPIIIINNNTYDRSNKSKQPTPKAESKSTKAEPAKPAKLGTMTAFYYHFGYATLEGEATLGHDELVPSTQDSFQTTGTGYLNFLSLSFGLSVAIGETEVSAGGAYVSGRIIAVTEGSYPARGLMYEAPPLQDENSSPIIGLGFDIGPYFRAGLWGKDLAGGFGIAVYATTSLLGSSPSLNTPFLIPGIGVMLDIFFTRNFGLSGRVELLYSRYESSFLDEFRAIGPSFSFGFAWGR